MMSEPNPHDTFWAVVKVAIAWVAGYFSSITGSDILLFATLVYTVLNTYVLYRDKVKRRANRPRSSSGSPPSTSTRDTL